MSDATSVSLLDLLDFYFLTLTSLLHFVRYFVALGDICIMSFYLLASL